MERSIKTARKTCYYKVLGVRVRAGQEEIRSAFRYLAMKWHPDRNPGNPKAAERFREVLTAYETLIDPKARGKYDRVHGHRRSKQAAPSGYSWTDLHSEGGGEAASFDEIFQDVFGMGRPKVRTRHGSDLRFDIQVPRSSLGSGCHEEISYERLVFCRNCNGNGASRVGCARCGGSGEHEETCSLRVWVPAGVEDGARIRVAGGGDSPYPSVSPGDLIILLHIIDNC
ncbi:MAG: DnaJ domain-containing protein [Syntrophobacteraceae bacterium]